MRRSLLCAWVLLAGCEASITTPPAPPPPAQQQGLDCTSARHPATTTLHRLTPREYSNVIADLFNGTVPPSAHYPAAYGTPVTGYSTEEAVNEVSEQDALMLMEAAEDVAVALEAQLPALLPCSQTAADQACLGTFLDTYARRAIRRPLSGDERAALQATFDQATADGAPFTQALLTVVAHLLQTPQFLYVVEDAAGMGRALNAWELASRLSFMLWDSSPDDALLSLAESGQLSDPQVLAAQAQRLLASPKADTALARLLREWSQAKDQLPTDKDSALFPFFTLAYTASLGEAFDRFAVDQLRSGGTLTSLFTSSDVFVDANLAPQYGVTASGWTKVTLDPSRYAGLSTQGLLLATDAHSTESSFVFRGRFVEKRMLCEVFGAPPANAQATLAATPLPPDPTGKEVAAAIISNGACASCHALLNPPGLAYEHFDATGRYRDTYASGRAIDVTGTLVGLSEGAIAFNDPVELSAKLAQTKEAQACAAAQVFRYTFSRAETVADQCALQAVSDALSKGGLAQALLSLTTTDAFTWRADP
jgi:hypothetical protein